MNAFNHEDSIPIGTNQLGRSCFRIVWATVEHDVLDVIYPCPAGRRAGLISVVHRMLGKSLQRGLTQTHRQRSRELGGDEGQCNEGDRKGKPGPFAAKMGLAAECVTQGDRRNKS